MKILLRTLPALFFALAAGCSTEPQKQMPQTTALPDQVLENFTTFGTKGGRKNWEMNAASARIFESRNLVEVENFDVDFFSPDGRGVKARLSAGKGRIDISKSDFYTEGKSVIVTEDKDVLKTSDLVYRNDKGMIYGEADVTLERKDAVVRGKGLETTPDLSSIVIKQNMVELRK
jgi:LPS export ABC transporter protein LptC